MIIDVETPIMYFPKALKGFVEIIRMMKYQFFFIKKNRPCRMMLDNPKSNIPISRIFGILEVMHFLLVY